MKSQENLPNGAPLRPLTAKELEVLWLYDCNFTDQKISKFLFLNDRQITSIKYNLYNTLGAKDIPGLLSSAINLGYVHKV